MKWCRVQQHWAAFGGQFAKVEKGLWRPNDCSCLTCSLELYYAPRGIPHACQRQFGKRIVMKTVKPWHSRVRGCRGMKELQSHEFYGHIILTLCGTVSLAREYPPIVPRFCFPLLVSQEPVWSTVCARYGNVSTFWSLSKGRQQHTETTALHVSERKEHSSFVYDRWISSNQREEQFLIKKFSVFHIKCILN